MQIDIREEGGHHTALRGSFLAWHEFDSHHDATFQKAPDERQHPFVRHPACDLRYQPLLRDFVEARADISFNHPGILRAPVEQRVQRLNAIHRRAPWSEAVGEVEEICLPDWLQYHFQQGLHDPVLNRGDT